MHHLKKGFRLSSGFTLTEVVCTLLLVQFIIALSVPFVFWSKRLFVYHEMQRLYAVLQYTQRKALIERAPCTLVFHPEKRSYTSDHEHVLHPEVVFGVQQGLCGPPSSARQPIIDPITWPHKKIVFYPPDHSLSTAGSMSSGTVYLTDRERSCSYALTCDASYGSILRRYQYKDGWKLIS